MYKCVVFDLDGTLLNTLDDLANAGNYALRAQGFPVFETERYKKFVGNGIPKLIERICPSGSDSETLERTHSIFSEYYKEHCLDRTAPYSGIAELLGRLSADGVVSIVVSNKDHIFSNKLIKLFFGENVKAVYGSREGFPKKPDPYWVNTALSEHGFNACETLYVGDSGVDMQTAKNAGLFACGVLWGFREREELIENGADAICETPDDVYDLVNM